MKHSLPKEEYTVAEFAKYMGFDEEYVRQCCRGYVNEKGTKAILPEGFYALPPHGWIIKKIQDRDKGHSLAQRLISPPQEKRIKKLEYYTSIKSPVLKSISFLYNDPFFVTSSVEIELTNQLELDFLKSKKLTETILGDYLLYQVYVKMESLDLTSKFRDNLHLFLKWFKLYNIKFSNSGLKYIDINNYFCAQCGRKIEYTSSGDRDKNKLVSYKNSIHFCNNQHARSLGRVFKRYAGSKEKIIYSVSHALKMYSEALEKSKKNDFNEFKKESDKLIKKLVFFLRKRKNIRTLIKLKNKIYTSKNHQTQKAIKNRTIEELLKNRVLYWTKESDWESLKRSEQKEYISNTSEILGKINEGYIVDFDLSNLITLLERKHRGEAFLESLSNFKDKESSIEYWIEYKSVIYKEVCLKLSSLLCVKE